MKEMPNEIVLDVTQTVINRSNKLRKKFALSQSCPLAQAGKDRFKRKNKTSIYVTVDGGLCISSKGDYFEYKPRAEKTVQKFVNDFDTEKNVKPTKFVYKLVKE